MFIFCRHRRMNLLLFLQVFSPEAGDDDRAKLEDDDDEELNTLLGWCRAYKL